MFISAHGDAPRRLFAARCAQEAIRDVEPHLSLSQGIGKREISSLCNALVQINQPTDSCDSLNRALCGNRSFLNDEVLNARSEMRGLTQRQAEALVLIRQRMANNRVSPTLQEIADLLGIRAKSGAHRLVETLIQRGYLDRIGHGFRVLDVPPDAPTLAIVEQRVERVVKETVVQDPVAEHPPADRARLASTRRKRTYVIELEADLHKRLRQSARSAKMPPERIIAMALRAYIMELDKP